MSKHTDEKIIEHLNETRFESNRELKKVSEYLGTWIVDVLSDKGFLNPEVIEYNFKARKVYKEVQSIIEEYFDKYDK